ncbi:MAG: hypothetical protein ACP5MG_03245 [Verrucomicrobiia bacterium]
MPIKLNLLAEAQAAEEMRRKDPVRYAFYGSGAIILIILGWIGMNQMLISGKTKELAGLQDSWNRMKPQYNLVQSNLAVIKEINQQLNLLTNYVTNRFLWANVLNALQQCITNVSTNVQFTRFRTDHNFQVTPPAIAVKEGKKIVIPGSSVETIKFIIDAKDYGKDEEDNITRLRETIASFPFFSERLDKTRGVRLESLSPRVSDPSDPNRPYVVFTIECQFQTRTR